MFRLAFYELACINKNLNCLAHTKWHHLKIDFFMRQTKITSKLYFFCFKVCDVWITTKKSAWTRKKIFLLNFFLLLPKQIWCFQNEERKWLCVRLRYFFVYMATLISKNRTKNKRIFFPTMIVVNEIVIYCNRQNAAGHGKSETTITNFSLYCMLCFASRVLFTNGKIYCYLNSTRVISFCNEIRLMFIQHH